MPAGKIIEIWRRNNGMDIPVKFAVGEVPAVLVKNAEGNSTLQPIQDGDGNPINLVVKDIDLREQGGIGPRRLGQPVVCVSFEDTAIERYFPTSEVIDVAYMKKDQ